MPRIMSCHGRSHDRAKHCLVISAVVTVGNVANNRSIHHVSTLDTHERPSHGGGSFHTDQSDPSKLECVYRGVNV